MIVKLLFFLIFIFKISFKLFKQCVDFGQRSNFKMTPSKRFGYIASELLSLTVFSVQCYSFLTFAEIRLLLYLGSFQVLEATNSTIFITVLSRLLHRSASPRFSDSLLDLEAKPILQIVSRWNRQSWPVCLISNIFFFFSLPLWLTLLLYLSVSSILALTRIQKCAIHSGHSRLVELLLRCRCGLSASQPFNDFLPSAHTEMLKSIPFVFVFFCYLLMCYKSWLRLADHEWTNNSAFTKAALPSGRGVWLLAAVLAFKSCATHYYDVSCPDLSPLIKCSLTARNFLQTLPFTATARARIVSCAYPWAEADSCFVEDSLIWHSHFNAKMHFESGLNSLFSLAVSYS